MLKKILTFAVPIIALIGGAFAGDILRPKPEIEATSEPSAQEASDHEGNLDEEQEEGEPAFLSFPNQFFVPMMRNGDMGAVMILTLSLETREPDLEAMKLQEHRLRDALLRQLMERANSGGFDGNFTSEAILGPLRRDLLKAVENATDLPVSAVLIEDIARQQN